MRKFFVVIASGLVSLPVFGQDLLQCVNPDVLKSLLFSGRSEMRMNVTSRLPRDLSNLRVSPEFELIGTAVRGEGTSTTVAYRTELASENAFAELLSSLEADGWAIEPEPSAVQAFSLTGQPVNGTVCRDSERISLSVRDADGVRYASLSSYNDPRARECGAEDPFLAMSGPGRFEEMRASLPRLAFPETTRPARGRGGLGGGVSGSGDTVSTSSTITSPDSSASLSEHLAAQMMEQGWRRDASWNGARSSGSTWMRDGSAGRPSWATLEIVSFDNDVYEVGIMLMNEPL